MTVKKSVKIIIISIIICSASLGMFSVPTSQARVSSYYSGDAAVYNGQIIVGSTNMGKFELFRWGNNGLVKTSTLRPEPLEDSQFYDLKFSEENGSLNVYLTSGRYLYKYNIGDVYNPIFIKKVKDNSNDGWISGFEKSSARIVTIGTKETKIWNDNLEIIDSFKITNIDNPYNIRFSADGRFIINVKEDKAEIFDTAVRRITGEVPIKTNSALNRKVYAGDYIYAVDDQRVIVFDYDAEIVGSFKHTSNMGYDADAIPGGKYVYFSDGKGIVKLDRSGLTAADWVNIDKLPVQYGWAMGMKVLEVSGKSYIVAFCNSYIGIFDEKLDLASFYRSREETFSPVEKVYLGIDKDRAPSGSLIAIHGGGYGQFEKIYIDLVYKRVETVAGEKGRFSIVTEVPCVNLRPEERPLKTDIRVTGAYTGISYNLGFTLE
ncbi:MAG: hypothetical protein WCW77_04960 [Patescibacteria group bacterium]|jgi:hypothetical protein